MVIRREISGPQEQFERASGEGYRDVRPKIVRVTEALKTSGSGLILCGMATATWFYPAALNVTLPISVLYATWVLTRRITLPLRLPASAKRKDWGYPDPKTRKPRRAAGSIFIGNDAFTNQELWITNDDGRQHGSVPGTTGAGKTTTILSLLANSLAHGSGFVLVDGKADNKLYGETMALARRFGREDDVRVLNFLAASGVKDSGRYNPFATGNADAIREMLLSQLGDQTTANDTNGVFRDRAITLIGILSPVLVWARDNKGVPISIDSIQYAFPLRWIWTIAKKRIFLSRDADTGAVTEIPVPDIPEGIIYPLLAYLDVLPGYDLAVPYNEQRTDQPSEQHGYGVGYFLKTFYQMTVSLGHIFRVENGDIDMRDIVLNRRILIVNLPALENGDDTLAALGKIVVAGLRGLMAQLLGARLEGDPDEIFALKPGSGETPFYIVFDEVSYYVTSGMDRMLAMGRGLNVAFWLAFQEIAGIYARIGDKTDVLLANANLTVAMRQQDANRTRTWLENTGGPTDVAQATSFHGGSVGQYREAQHADVKQVSRIDWRDLQRLIEGEAIVMLAGRRVYAKMFHANVEITGPVRMNRPLMLPKPDESRLRRSLRAADTILANLQGGLVVTSEREEEHPLLTAMLDTFAAKLSLNAPIEACAIAAIGAVDKAHRARLAAGERDPDGGETAEPPVTDLLSVLQAAERTRPNMQPDPGLPRHPVSAEMMRMLMAIEIGGVDNQQEARRASLSALAERDRARELSYDLERPLSRGVSSFILALDQIASGLAFPTPI